MVFKWLSKNEYQSNLLLQPITTVENSAMNQSDFLAITCNLLKARENRRKQVSVAIMPFKCFCTLLVENKPLFSVKCCELVRLWTPLVWTVPFLVTTLWQTPAKAPIQNERFSNDCQNQYQSNLLLRPITTGANTVMNQWKVLVITCNLLKARERSRVQGGLASHW